MLVCRAFFAKPASAGARAVKAAFVTQAGGGGEALKSRSALLSAEKLRAATLILNGAKDDRTDPEQARRLAAAIRNNGVGATAHIYPEFGHAIAVKARDGEVTVFIASVLKP